MAGSGFEESILPLWNGEPSRLILWQAAGSTSLAQFQRQVAVLVAQLPAGSAMINLCDDRRHFLLAYAAAASAGHTVLLPASRAEQIVAEVAEAHPQSYRCDDALVLRALNQAAAAASPAWSQGTSRPELTR